MSQSPGDGSGVPLPVDGVGGALGQPQHGQAVGAQGLPPPAPAGGAIGRPPPVAGGGQQGVPYHQNVGNLAGQPAGQQAGNQAGQPAGNQAGGYAGQQAGNPPRGQPYGVQARVTMDEVNFSKLAPKFHVGEGAWELYYDRFQNLATMHYVGNSHFKGVMYANLAGEAFALASPNYAPTKAPYNTMSASEYAKVLQKLFEPDAESEAMKLEFINRMQEPGEHPDRYYRDKVRMFQRAFAPQLRDWTYFYKEVINGLINQEMRYQLRGFRPVNPSDPVEFMNELTHWATVQRQRYMAGEVTQSDVLGAEAHSSGISYRNYGKPSTQIPKIKTESINAVQHGRAGRQHQPTKDSQRCWHCGDKDHYIAKCPRKITGLAPSVAVAEDGEVDPDGAVAQLSSNSAPLKRRVPFGRRTNMPVRTSKDGKGQNGFRGSTRGSVRGRLRRFNQRVAHVYEDADGHTFIEDIPLLEEDASEDEVEGTEDADSEGHTEQAASEAQDGVHALSLDGEYQNDFSETDFIPGAFLGV